MRAGPLRHRCSLQQQQRTSDGMGGYAQQWVELRKVWTEISIPTGRVSTVAQQLTATVTAEMLARPAADLVAGRRLLYGGITYQIEAVLPDNKRSMLRLLCSSIAKP